MLWLSYDQLPDLLQINKLMPESTEKNEKTRKQTLDLGIKIALSDICYWFMHLVDSSKLPKILDFLFPCVIIPLSPTSSHYSVIFCWPKALIFCFRLFSFFVYYCQRYAFLLVYHTTEPMSDNFSGGIVFWHTLSWDHQSNLHPARPSKISGRILLLRTKP